MDWRSCVFVTDFFLILNHNDADIYSKGAVTDSRELESSWAKYYSLSIGGSRSQQTAAKLFLEKTVSFCFVLHFSFFFQRATQADDVDVRKTLAMKHNCYPSPSPLRTATVAAKYLGFFFNQISSLPCLRRCHRSVSGLIWINVWQCEWSVGVPDRTIDILAFPFYFFLPAADGWKPRLKSEPHPKSCHMTAVGTYTAKNSNSRILDQVEDFSVLKFWCPHFFPQKTRCLTLDLGDKHNFGAKRLAIQ